MVQVKACLLCFPFYFILFFIEGLMKSFIKITSFVPAVLKQQNGQTDTDLKILKKSFCLW